MHDFSNLKYKLREVQAPDLFRVYPELEQIHYEAKLIHGSAEHSPLSPQELMAFVVYAYDLKSPIVQVPSIHRRRAEALELVGYPMKTEDDLRKYRAYIQFVTGTNDFVNRLALQYCKLQNTFDWMELCSLQDLLDDVDLTLKQESEGTEKKSAQEILKLKLEIRDKSTKTRNEMKALATSLFLNDVNLISYAASQIILEKRKPIITPERYVAKKRAEREAEQAN